MASNNTHQLLQWVEVLRGAGALKWVEILWLAGGGCGWNMCVASRCGCKEVNRFPHNYYLSLLLLYIFYFAAASILLGN